jgi:hypothetical protein
MRENVISFKYRAGMIRSVSISFPRTGTALPEILLIFDSRLIIPPIVPQLLLTANCRSPFDGAQDERKTNRNLQDFPFMLSLSKHV